MGYEVMIITATRTTTTRTTTMYKTTIAIKTIDETIIRLLCLSISPTSINPMLVIAIVMMQIGIVIKRLFAAVTVILVVMLLPMIVMLPSVIMIVIVIVAVRAIPCCTFDVPPQNFLVSYNKQQANTSRCYVSYSYLYCLHVDIIVFLINGRILQNNMLFKRRITFHFIHLFVFFIITDLTLFIF